MSSFFRIIKGVDNDEQQLTKNISRSSNINEEEEKKEGEKLPEKDCSFVETRKVGGTYDHVVTDNPSRNNVLVEEDKKEELQNVKREQWATPLESLLSFLALSVGLGNFWRFPVLTYENGGAAFFVPYIIVVCLVGTPLFLIEQYMGQFSGCGPIRIWHMVPAARGVGFGQLIASFSVATYYNSIVALSLFYLIHSCYAPLPWSFCNPEWATKECEVGVNISRTTEDNITSPVLPDFKSGLGHQLSAEQFFKRYVLQMSDSIEDGIGVPSWRMSLCLLCTCLLSFLALVRGVKSSTKAFYILTMFPYAAITILLIKASTLAGAWEGILYYLTPNWHKLTEASVWYNAVSQVFFSLGVGYGFVTVNSSYNPFHRNCYKSAMMIALLDTCTSVLAGFAIFSVLGHMAYDLRVEIKSVVRMGTGLAFISFPAALLQLNAVPQFFTIIYFSMLFCLGLGTAVPVLNLFVTVICDNFPKAKRLQTTLLLSLAQFLFGLIYLMPGGQYILQLVDHFSGGFAVYVLTLVEVIAVVWIYGMENLCHDLEFMRKDTHVNQYWKLCWNYFIPLSMIAIFSYSLIHYREPQYGDHTYPPIFLVFGWILTASALMQVPGWAAYTVYTAKSEGILEQLQTAFYPDKYWGPRNKRTRKEWMKYQEDCEKLYLLVPK